MENVLELDKKRALYWRSRASDLFKEMKVEVLALTGKTFNQSVVDHRELFDRIGPRFVLITFTKKAEFVRVLGEYDQSMICIKSAQSQSVTPTSGTTT
jgi:hypothetical protein